MNVFFITFGCKVNLCETESLKQLFSQNGYTIAESEENADIFIVNSCTVTAVSDAKNRKCIHSLRRSHPDAIIVLTGCFPQAFREKAESIKEADIITGTKDRAEILNLVNETVKNKKRCVNIKDYSKSDIFEPLSCDSFKNNTRAFIKIQDGCNQFCTYCIIPYSRGRNRSKPLQDIIKETEIFAANGYKEIVLTGINLCFYGSEYGLRLVDAIEAVCKADGIERVRLSSLEPEVISDDDLKRMANLHKLCPHFHLSLQSGCERTLRAMHRHYTPDEYRLLVKKLREFFPDCSITTDIMTGFPDETDDDFKESLKFIEEIGFAQAHVFPYSRREGTPAAAMKNQITKKIKNHRAAEVSRVTRISQENFIKQRIGRIYPVLFEREKYDGFHCGHTPNYIYVKVAEKNLNKDLRNSIFYVKILEYTDDGCIGEIISD